MALNMSNLRNDEECSKLVNFENDAVDVSNSSRSNSEYDKAMINKDWDRLVELIESGADYLRAIDSKERINALGEGVYYHKNNLVRLIIRKQKEKGEFSEQFQRQCTNALWIACNNNNSELVSILLEAGAEIIENYHPHTAAESGAWRVLKELKKNRPGLDLNRIDADNNTPLYYATRNGYIHTINWLLCHGAEVNFFNSMGDSALHIACQDADEEIVHLLLKKGANINATNNYGETPVLIAARIGKESHILILASQRANLDQRDHNGNFPLRIACENGHTNVIKELITNGASFRVTNDDWYSCMERAIENRRDEAVAMCIRLYPSENYIKECRMKFKIPFVDLVKFKLIETVKALLDRMLVEPSEEIDGKHAKGKILTKYLEIDSGNLLPKEDRFNYNDTDLLQHISLSGSSELAYHGTIRILVDRKMSNYGYAILGVRLALYTLFLFTLGSSLILATYEPDSEHFLMFSSLHDYPRLIAELFTLFYFVGNLFTEGIEFFRVSILTYHSMIRVRNAEEEERQRQSEMVHRRSRLETLKRSALKVKKIFIIRVLLDYFKNNSNYWDVLGLLSLFILIIFRAARSPIQWIFASIAFFINAMRLFKLIVLIPVLGPYSNIFYNVLKDDLPKFAILFLITLCIFTGTFHISLFVPTTPEGFRNLSLFEETRHLYGITDQVYWVFLSGLRILVQGNILDGNYLYNLLNWMSTTIYLTFLFLIVIVFVNVFIAQLSDTYSKFEERADYSFAWHRLNFIIQIQRTSIISIFKRIRKWYIVESIVIGKDELNEYFGVKDIKQLNLKSFNEKVDVKGMLCTMQSQQFVNEKLNHAFDDFPFDEDYTNVDQRLDSMDERMNHLAERFDLRIEKLFELLTQLCSDSRLLQVHDIRLSDVRL
ncbi:Ankyrin repeat domain-containing 29-like [Oopsacas minuta]|uniref:Ankyrin repeat domain-containing 29-like n=1 Tax=Oopsacas minuta TaxID=111878 RepID=A0AAV7JYC9_9METZ|nr:Ankyrin repeat domain-containing 29-like [Oopsacas minuta]